MTQEALDRPKERRAAPLEEAPPASSGMSMKAFILNGDVLKSTHDYREVAEAHAEGRRFWIELDDRTPEADKFLEEVLKIHPLAIEDVWNDIGLPKVEDFGEYVQIVMHGVREEDRDGSDVPLALAELDVLVGRNFIVTHAHDEKVCAIGTIQHEMTRNPRLLRKGPAFVAHAILDGLVDEYIPLIERINGTIEEVELEVLAGKTVHEPGDAMRDILKIRRSLQMLRRTTVYQREILLRLSRAEFDEIPAEAMPFYRDVYDHMARVTELVDSYREGTTSVLEAHFSMQSQQMNEIMKRLTVISTIMLPLTLIAGIYGMNFETMPELKWANGYYFALALMSTIGVGIVYFFRRKRWL